MTYYSTAVCPNCGYRDAYYSYTKLDPKCCGVGSYSETEASCPVCYYSETVKLVKHEHSSHLLPNGLYKATLYKILTIKYSRKYLGTECKMVPKYFPKTKKSGIVYKKFYVYEHKYQYVREEFCKEDTQCGFKFKYDIDTYKYKSYEDFQLKPIPNT